MARQFIAVFKRLRSILEKHAAGFSIREDKADYYGLEAPVGPATLAAWGGKMKSPKIPIAWVQYGKSHVSYHLMGIYGQPKLLEGCSKELRARMQGKSCFNFNTVDEALFTELNRLTGQCLLGMKTGGYIAELTPHVGAVKDWASRTSASRGKVRPYRKGGSFGKPNQI